MKGLSVEIGSPHHLFRYYDSEASIFKSEIKLGSMNLKKKDQINTIRPLLKIRVIQYLLKRKMHELLLDTCTHVV